MEGFEFVLSVVGWAETQEQMQEQLLALFPATTSPVERGFDVVVVKAKRLTHKGRD